VIEAGGKRIGVTGALGAKFEQGLRGDELVHQPPLEALKAAASELASQKCDFRVLLAHASMDEARNLAAEVPGFDLVVASGEASMPTTEIETIGGTTRLLQVGQKAMYASVIGVFDDSATPVRHQIVPLDSKFADSPMMLELLKNYQEELKELGLEGLGIKPQPHPSGRRFVGSEKCGECHTEAYKVWKSSRHAHATESLVHPPNSRGDIARHFDPECLSLERTPQLTASGCENCHGPGSAHVAAEAGEGQLSAGQIAKLRDAMKLPLAGAEQKCALCHDPDNSPDFHKDGAFERYWEQVKHSGKD
jgi:hypothetical protein